MRHRRRCPTPRWRRLPPWSSPSTRRAPRAASTRPRCWAHASRHRRGTIHARGLGSASTARVNACQCQASGQDVDHGASHARRDRCRRRRLECSRGARSASGSPALLHQPVDQVGQLLSPQRLGQDQADTQFAQYGTFVIRRRADDRDRQAAPVLRVLIEPPNHVDARHPRPRRDVLPRPGARRDRGLRCPESGACSRRPLRQGVRRSSVFGANSRKV